ncbi:hypothetical protein [Arthrobacter sp. efr-133-TYG-118]|nr:hypothetical protein [Arthrobacter sp. efr-133-TYG-118]
MCVNQPLPGLEFEDGGVERELAGTVPARPSLSATRARSGDFDGDV